MRANGEPPRSRGLNVYNDANEKIGDISELLVDQTGKVEAVVIGVGGFLGMGEHDVAVPFDQIKFVNEPRAAATAANTTTTGTAGTTMGTTLAPQRRLDHDDDDGRAGRHHEPVGSGSCSFEHDQGSAQGGTGIQVQPLRGRRSSKGARPGPFFGTVYDF